MRNHVAGHLILPSSVRVTLIEPFPAVSAWQKCQLPICNCQVDVAVAQQN